MGCHTWFGRRLLMTHEEAAKNYLDSRQEYINNLKTMLDSTSDLRISLRLTDEYLHHQIAVEERRNRMIAKGLCRVAVAHNQPGSIEYIDGMFYDFAPDDLPHDLFRIGGYPQDKLRSYDETMDFLETHAPKIYGYNENIKEQLKQFWYENPDGIIHFG